MANASVFTPLFDEDAVRSVNFFNGRVLSGEDLSTERAAEQEERRRLAQGLGAGVVRGLQVHVADGGSGPMVTVTAGLAFDAAGDSIALPNDTDLSLLELKPGAGDTPATVEPFAHCTPPEAGTYIAGAGVYLLTISRTTGMTGFAPVSGLGNELAGCNRKYLVEGVEFRLPKVPVSASWLGAPALLRNRLAYACFATASGSARATGVLDAAVTSDDPLADMRKAGAIARCEVPLALIYWTAAGVQFVDPWAVRRRPATTMDATPGDLVDPLRVATAEARLLQFQAQLGDVIRTSPSLSALDVRAHFTYLPPAAFLPITGVREENSRLRPAAATSSALAVDYERFFGSRMKVEPRFIEGARVGPLLRESLACPPIDLSGGEMFWLYVVRENVQAVERGAAVAPYMIVASPHLRYQADARFDVSRWNYASFL